MIYGVTWIKKTGPWWKPPGAWPSCHDDRESTPFSWRTNFRYNLR